VRGSGTPSNSSGERTAPQLASKSQTDTRAAVERLQHDLAELAATLERNESR